MEVYYEKKKFIRSSSRFPYFGNRMRGPALFSAGFLPQKKPFPHKFLSPADTPSAEASSADTDVKTSSITGTIDEIKDFMFNITDSEGTSFVLSFDATPEGLSDVKNGDTVTVTYTGELSEVDAFTGTVISVKKAEK